MLSDISIKIANEDDLLALCDLAADKAMMTDEHIYEAFKISTTSCGPAYSIFYKGRLVGSSGLHIVRKGVANVWAVVDSSFELLPAGKLPTAESLDYLTDILWLIDNFRQVVCERFGIKRIRAVSRKGFKASQRLLRCSGFTQLRRQSKGNYYYVWEAG